MIMILNCTWRGRHILENICSENKKILAKRLNDDLIKSKNDPKLFWKNVKKMSGFHKPVSNCIKPVEWSFHFRKLLNTPAENDGNFESFVLENLREHDVNCENCLGYVNGQESDLNLLNDKITIDGISKAINKMKSNKAPGFDGVTIEFIKEAKFFFLPMLEKLFDHILSAGIYPKEWGKALLYPLHKKESKADPSNNRGISLISVISKISTRDLIIMQIMLGSIMKSKLGSE